jgi:hypothetical protein
MSDIETPSLAVARAAKNNDNRLLSPLDMLSQAYKEIKSGEVTANKLVIIALDTGAEGEDYETSLFMCNIKTSEVIALLEVIKQGGIKSITDAA